MANCQVLIARAAGADNLAAILPRGFHPFPSRTRKLSPAGPIVLRAKVRGRVGRRRIKIKGSIHKNEWSLLCLGGAKPLTTDNTDRTDFALHEPAESCGTAAPAVRGRTPARAPVPHVRGRVGRRRIKIKGSIQKNKGSLLCFGCKTT